MNTAGTPSALFARALERLDTWIEKEEFRGWDPHDALNSVVLRRIAGGNRRLGMTLVQALRRSPLNLRPLLGVRKGINPKAMGLFMATYAHKFLLRRQVVDLDRVQYFWPDPQ